MRRLLRLRHYSPRTVDVYLGWVRRFVHFHGRRHPRDLGEKDISAYLSSLATRQRVAAGTQNQALAAILFMYRHVLEIPMSVSSHEFAPIVEARGLAPISPGFVLATPNEEW